MKHFFQALRHSLGAVLLFAAAPVAAQTITWEVANRFAAFEAYDKQAPDVFRQYKFRNRSETAEQWHARQWQTHGRKFTSPYAPLLATKAAASGLHWDAEMQVHRAWMRAYARQDGTATVRVRVSAPVSGMCEWAVGQKGKAVTKPCKGAIIEVPQKGANVRYVAQNGASGDDDINPENILIVGLGDSYGSGEGNPDIPVSWKRWGDDIRAPRANTPRWLQKRQYRTHGARWLDDACHRSFFSHQSLTALRIASRNPKAFVTFLHYACSGAEMFDGVIVRQNAPPGTSDTTKQSQLAAAVADLCDNRVKIAQSHAIAPRQNTDLKDRRFRNWEAPDFSDDPIARCSTELKVSPDLVLLSIGGNDAGFSSLVAFHVAPTTFRASFVERRIRPDICPDGEFAGTSKALCAKRRAKIGFDMGELIPALHDKYDVTFDQITQALNVQRRAISIPQYPDPLRKSFGKTFQCIDRTKSVPEDLYGEEPGYNVLSPWEALKSFDKSGLSIKQKWEFNFRGGPKGENCEAMGQVKVMRRSIANYFAKGAGRSVGFVPGTADAFVGHGWQEGVHRNLPNYARAGTPSDNWNPADWEPYAYDPDGRAFRTSNDSFLTQVRKGEGNTGLHGTAHPNLFGHARVADIVFQDLPRRRTGTAW